MSCAAETIRQYCERERLNDDLESLYFVLHCQFNVQPDDVLNPKVRAVLESLPH
jgi:hypothetical protein